MMHTGKPSRSSDSCDTTMEPSTFSVGDMVTVLFNQPNPEIPVKGGRRLYGKIMQVGEYGAIVAPCTRTGLRLVHGKVYCPDADCIVEEVNGESLF